MPLSPQQQNELEDKALRALGGSARRDLVNGIRLMSGSGPQIAAVYWSNLNPGNEVEIAVCDSRISEKYDIGLIQRWIDLQKTRWPAHCNTHQPGSEWPTFGLSYAETSDFFRSVYRLRQGRLGTEELRSLESMGQARSGEQASEARVRAELASLRPNRRNAVYDLVYRAGVSVAPWSLTGNGTPLSRRGATRRTATTGASAAVLILASPASGTRRSRSKTRGSCIAETFARPQRSLMT